MDTNNFILNDIFKENAKVYQTKPVRATKYHFYVLASDNWIIQDVDGTIRV